MQANLGVHAPYGFTVHALKSTSDTFGNFRMNATMDQISLSSAPIAPEAWHCCHLDAVLDDPEELAGLTFVGDLL
jgi:hypothetical protein